METEFFSFCCFQLTQNTEFFYFFFVLDRAFEFTNKDVDRNRDTVF